MITNLSLPGFKKIEKAHGWKILDKCSDNLHETGKNGVKQILSTGDGKVELIGFSEKTLAYVKSEMDYPAYYPIKETNLKKPIKAVLMDLDGTTVHSEEFWIWIIEKTVASLTNNETFKFTPEDIPYVSGHSVSEHLCYCIEKYAKNASIKTAREHYTAHTEQEMNLIMEGKGKPNAFTPAPGIKEFLINLKKENIKIALVTSGLYRKAYPEIISAFKTLNLGNPEEFYDAIITAGYPLGEGKPGTLGELQAKPHPWLYAEACRVGLNIEDRDSVMGIEDSGAGVCALRLAGYTTIGIAGGNIISSGTRGMCDYYCESFDEILELL